MPGQDFRPHERLGKDEKPYMPGPFRKEPEEKSYIGSKIIRGVPMDECKFLATEKGQDVTNRETRPGYRVTYPDGYVSWSPKDVFENAYREITDEEKSLI